MTTKSRTPISDERYSEYMATIAGHAPQFLMVRMDYARYLGDGNASNILAYLLNLLRLKDGDRRDRQKLRDNRFWFKVPLQGIADHFNLTYAKVRGAMKILKDKGIVLTKARGIPPTTWVKVRDRELDKMIEWGLEYVRELKGQKVRSAKPNEPECNENATSEPDSQFARSSKLVCYGEQINELNAAKQATNNPSNNSPLQGGGAEAPLPPSPNSTSTNGKPDHGRLQPDPPRTENKEGDHCRCRGDASDGLNTKEANDRRSNHQPSLTNGKKFAPFCYEAQARFRKLLRDNGHTPTAWEGEKGAESVNRLLKYLEGNESRVRRVLEWYPAHAGEVEEAEGPDEVFSIHTFCKRGMFKWLERLMGGPPEEPRSTVEEVDNGDGTVTVRIRSRKGGHS